MVSAKAHYYKMVASCTKVQLGFVIICTFLIPVGLIYALVVVSSRSADVTFVDELRTVHGPVIHVNLLYRHGERTIDVQLPLDPFRHEKYWPEGFAQLTKDGILQHYHLGQWLATRYRHLLPDNWENLRNAISVRSTDYDRTLTSAQAQLAGMFPIRKDVNGWKGLTNYIVPVHSVPSEDDDFIDMSRKCDRYDALMNETKLSKPYRLIMSQYGHIVKLVKDNYGYEIDDLHGFQRIYTTLQIEESRGLKLPEWTSQIYPRPIIEPAILSFKAPTWTDSLKRLRGGNLLKHFLKNFKDKLSDKNFRNVSSYSGHDTSLGIFLNSLDIFNDETPPAAGLVMMELRQMNHTAPPIVTIFYKNSTNEPFQLAIPNCPLGCPLDRLEANLKPIIPDDWENECKLSNPF